MGGEITGLLPGAAPACGADHSVVPAASTQGLPIHGTRRVIVLSNRTVARVDLGSAYHTGPPAAGVTRTATALLDRSRNTMDETPAAREPDGAGQLAVPLAGAE